MCKEISGYRTVCVYDLRLRLTHRVLREVIRLSIPNPLKRVPLSAKFTIQGVRRTNIRFSIREFVTLFVDGFIWPV